jgi:hypothetical protein
MVSCISPEQRIPANHPLRLIRALVLEALKDLSRSQGKFYWRDGRPSISPEQLLSALLSQTFYGIRSERQLMKQREYNPLVRLTPDDRRMTRQAGYKMSQSCRAMTNASSVGASSTWHDAQDQVARLCLCCWQLQAKSHRRHLVRIPRLFVPLTGESVQTSLSLAKSGQLVPHPMGNSRNFKSLSANFWSGQSGRGLSR